MSSQVISVIIPARNEEQNIERLLSSLAKFKNIDEILVVDDGSTDQTAIRAKEWGAEVITSGELPAGWTGKAYALQRGAQEASGDFYLFLDADTWVTPNLLTELKRCRNRESEAVSILPFHETQKWTESFSLFFNVILALGCGVYSLCPAQTQRLVGPSLFVQSQDYWKVGGHEKVKNEVLENLALTRFFREKEIRVRTFFGRGSLSFQMFPSGSLQEIFTGWSKGFSRGGDLIDSRIHLAIILWLVELTAIPFLLFFSLFYTAALLYLINVGFLFFLSRPVGKFHLCFILFYPLPLTFYYAVFLMNSIGLGQVDWKGRSVNRGKTGTQ